MRPTRRAGPVLAGTVVLIGAALLLGGCATAIAPERASGARLEVVAAEDFWGSIVGQLGGDRTRVVSIISNPATDPHDYEATAQDARRVASADYVIVNGIGYDGWAQKLLDVGGVTGRRGPPRAVLDVGKLVGVAVGGNPHQWYSPSSVQQVVARVADDLARLDPAHARYFAQRRDAYEASGLAEYHGLLAQIRQRFHGTPIGASESVIAPLVGALGLTMKTPRSFLDAVAEGTEPSARDTAVVNRQIADHEIAVFVYNTQNATPDVRRLVAAARAKGIPVATVTETLVPAGATFQAWQATQLRGLRDALIRAEAA
jgi:zinc/manganese transport system substrate-binding protein